METQQRTKRLGWNCNTKGIAISFGIFFTSRVGIQVKKIQAMKFDYHLIDALLPSIYALPHRPVLHHQDAATCGQFVEVLTCCVEEEVCMYQTVNQSINQQIK